MNWKMIWRIIAHILLVEIVLMIPACGISMFLHETAAVYAFLETFGIMAVVVVGLRLWTRNARKGRFYARDGLVTTGLTWIAISVLGCLPFWFSGAIPHYVDAVFEMVSGFTTTGSSILTEVESMAKGLLWWRSFSHWVGGMGILVFLMAIVRLGGKNQGFTMHLLRAESPGPAVGKMVPRMKDTASILYGIYIGLTVVDIILLLLGGVSFFEACCTAFGTAGTGGFGVRNDSLTSYSPYVQDVTTVFMLLFSVNFSVYYLMVIRKLKDAFMDDEFRFFWFVVFVSIVLLTISARPMYETLQETIRHCAFTVATIMSTTGFSTTDYHQWPEFAHSIILILMMFGACAGSTGGGMKQIRFLMLFRILRRNIHKSLHPNEVQSVMVNNRPIDEMIVNNVSAYLIVYVLIILLSTLIVSVDGFSIETNLSAVMATFNNIGPGFDMVGPTGNFSQFSDFSKIVLIGDMLAGRLEIYPMLILLSRSTWKKAR